MNFNTISRRLAATAGVSALAAGALVGVTTTTATAAPEVTNDYVCSTASGLAFPVALTTNAVGIEGFPQITAGASVPAGLLSVTNTATMPAAAAQALGGNGVSRLVVPDFAPDFGGNPVGTTGVEGLVSNIEDNGDGTVSLDLPKDDPATGNLEAGVNKAFEVPKAGSYDILMPSAFSIDAYNAEGALVTTINCALAEGEAAEALHSIDVVKSDSVVTATPAKTKIAKGKAAKVAVAVTGNELEGDKVLLKKGTKTLDKASLNEAGKATLSTKALAVGKNKLKVVYKGSPFNEKATSEVFTIKVTN